MGENYSQEICKKTVYNYTYALKPVSECYKIKLLILIRLRLKMSLNVIRLQKCVIKQFTHVFLYLILFLINIKFKENVTLYTFLSLYTLLKVCCPDKYITQKKCNEAVDDSPAALKLIPDWFVRRKMIIKLYKGNWTRSHNHLAHKGTLKWLSVCL